MSRDVAVDVVDGVDAVDVVVFDLDGTLLDLPVDIEAVRARLAAVFAPRGFALPFRPVLARIDEAATMLARDPAERARLVRLGRSLLDGAEHEAARAARPRPGAAALLAGLLARGVPVGIWTDNGRPCVDPALRAAGLTDAPWPADRVCSRDDAPAPKPDPRGLAALVERLVADAGGDAGGDAGTDTAAGAGAGTNTGTGTGAGTTDRRARVFVVGDAPRDLEAARAVAPLLPGVLVRAMQVTTDLDAVAAWLYPALDADR
jgi:phosphoglycolate phosphatase-like HAD superfamily hydrolase